MYYMKFCIYLYPIDILKSIYLPTTSHDNMWVLLQLVQMASLGAFYGVFYVWLVWAVGVCPLEDKFNK